MKTKIRTNLAILALAAVGLININAIADNKKSVSIDFTSEKSEKMTNETWMTETAVVYSAEAFTYRDVIEEIEKFEAGQAQAEVSELNEETVVYSAKAFSDSEFEKELEDYLAK